jgi:hypothetical protein
MSFLSNSYVFRLQRYYFLIKYAIFLRKIRFFYKNICSMYAGYALSFSETVVPSDAALLLYHTYWRSCLPCTALPFSHTAAYPRGVRHSMYCALSSKWGLFGRNTRSAIQGTSSRSSLGCFSVFARCFEARYKKGERDDNINKTHFFGLGVLW